MYNLFDKTCNWIDVYDEFDENVKNKINVDLIVIVVVHVFWNNVKNVINDVIEIDLEIDTKFDVSSFNVIDNVIEIVIWIDLTKIAIDVSFNIIIENDIVKKIFDDDDDEIDVLWFWINAKINDVKFDVS